MNIKYNKALWLIIILAIVMMIPFLGLTDFNTKGEPREAVVAYTMLEHGNWILPINNGGDIPYKPPFFHWCIAFFSLFIGHVNEYTSRLPSAVSLVLMTIGGFVFYAKRKNAQTSLIAAILTLTAFEVHRAGMNCRVDMLNTAFMVGAMYLLYRWWEKGKHQLPWLAILCMSGATLTKGPVGIILPCFVMGVFMLTQRENFWGIAWRMALTALLSLVIPFCWYYAAYLQGGDEFLRLVKEENIDRFMGKMAYESHENPAWYNLLTLITGWLPYTLLLLFSLFILPWKKFSKTRFLENAKKATPLQVLDPDSYPSPENSASGFFVYGLGWGVNQGILKDRKYKKAARKGWKALKSYVHEDGMLGYVQPVSAAPEQVTQNMTEVYGVGAFLMAGIEMLKMK